MDHQKNRDITTASEILETVTNEMRKPKKTKAPKIKREHMLAGIIAGAVLLLAIFFTVGGSQELTDTDAAALVNGQVISLTELNKIYDATPEQLRGAFTKESVLEEMIQGEILYQEATKDGFDVSKEEAVGELETLKTQQGVSDEQFEAILSQQQFTLEQYLEEFRKQLSIQRFIDNSIVAQIEVTNKEIEEYYETNIDQFKLKEQVTVKHVLIGDEELSAEEQEHKAKELLEELNEENFCEYVTEYSTDVGSLSTCGEYTFSRDDPYVEEFKALSFEQNPGDIGTANTQFGTHIIWTVEIAPARTITMQEAEEEIKSTIRNQKSQKTFDDYYDELRETSDVEILLLENTEP